MSAAVFFARLVRGEPKEPFVVNRISSLTHVSRWVTPGLMLLMLNLAVSSAALAQGGGIYNVDLYPALQPRLRNAGIPSWPPYAAAGEVLRYEVRGVVSDWDKSYDDVSYLLPVRSFDFVITLPPGVAYLGDDEFDDTGSSTRNNWTLTEQTTVDGREQLRFTYDAGTSADVLIPPGGMTQTGLGLTVEMPGTTTAAERRLLTELRIESIVVRDNSSMEFPADDANPDNNVIYRMTIIPGSSEPTPSFDLEVGVTGPGAVTSSPAGIDCPATCVATFDDNTVVTLTATPDAGASFGSWTGPCDDPLSAQCVVTMSQARSVEALFTEPSTASLSIVVDGSGAVTDDGGQIDCPGTCGGLYTQGQTVTLTAAPSSGAIFAGWSGACSGTATTCQVTLSSSLSATAEFLDLSDDPVVYIDGFESAETIAKSRMVSKALDTRFLNVIRQALVHGRCQNCHNVARFPEYLIDRGEGGSAHHLHSVTTDNRNCAGCHAGIRPDWHAPVGMSLATDYRYSTDTDIITGFKLLPSDVLCAMVKTHPPGHPDDAGEAPDPATLKKAREHLVEDELLLWAFETPTVPASDPRPRPQDRDGIDIDRQRWIDTINDWFDDGAPCTQ